MNLLSSGDGPMVKCPWCRTRFHEDTVAELHSCPVCRVAWTRHVYHFCGIDDCRFVGLSANDLYHHYHWLHEELAAQKAKH
jgi:hypothetical protein